MLERFSIVLEFKQFQTFPLFHQPPNERMIRRRMGGIYWFKKEKEPKQEPSYPTFP
jgi:Fic family protein